MKSKSVYLLFALLFLADASRCQVLKFISAASESNVTGIQSAPTFKKIKQERIPGSLSFMTDQDFFFDALNKSKNQDRNYTQGTAFTYSHPNLMNSFLFWPQQKFDTWLDFEQYGSSISLAGTAFTPLDLDSTKPIVGDRPFSFLLYISTSATLKNIKYKLPRFHTLSINYGLFGTNIGYAFQTYAHKQLVTGRSKDPKGWNTQISKGGAPTLLIDYNRFQSLLEFPKRKGTVGERGYFDLGWNLGGSVGYYHRVYTGLYMRAGLFKKESQARWNNGWSVLGGASYELETAPTGKKVTRSLETFFYTKVNFTGMLRNSMLVGQIIKESEYEMKYSWTKKLLAEWEWGFVFAWEKQKSRDRGPRTRSAFVRAVYRTPEFDSGIFPVRNHYFASAGIMGPLITY
jgi:hypothetical protein